MTATVDQTWPPPTHDPTESVYLWGPGYTLTARQIIDALGSYLATFGDNLGPACVHPLDAIHAEVVFGGDLTHWQSHRTPEQIATIRARAEAVAREFFGPDFPVLAW